MNSCHRAIPEHRRVFLGRRTSTTQGCPTKHDAAVSAKSIMGLLTLIAPCDADIDLEAEGEDAVECLATLGHVIEVEFFPTDCSRTIDAYVRATGHRRHRPSQAHSQAKPPAAFPEPPVVKSVVN